METSVDNSQTDSRISVDLEVEFREDLQEIDANGLEEFSYYAHKIHSEEVVEKFDTAASRCMSGRKGRIIPSDMAHIDVQITGFNGSVSMPDQVGKNRDGKKEYYVSNMPNNLALLCGYNYAKDGAVVLHGNGGLLLQMDDDEVQALLEFVSQYPVTKRLQVKNRTYEVIPVEDGTPSDTVFESENANFINEEYAFSNTAAKFFNTKVNVSNSTERIMTLLLTGLTLSDWYYHLKHGSLEGIPPDLSSKALNSFANKYGKMPDIIRLAVPYMYGNKMGLMSSEPLSRVGQRFEIDNMESDYNIDDSERIEGVPKKLPTHGGAIAAVVMVDCYSGYVRGQLLKALRNSKKYLEGLIEATFADGVDIELIAADSGVVSQSKYQVITPEVESYLHTLAIKTERVEPHNHSRGGSHVERVIRSIKELTRMAMGFILNNPNFGALGFSKQQILKLWGEIFYWAIGIINLKLCPNDKTKSKFEVFHKKKPNMQNIRLLPIFSVILVNRDRRGKDSQTNQARNQVGLYVGPAFSTPGAIRAAIITGNNLEIVTTSRFSAATDGGGLNVYTHIESGTRKLISESKGEEVEQESNESVSKPKKKRGRPRKNSINKPDSSNKKETFDAQEQRIDIGKETKVFDSLDEKNKLLEVRKTTPPVIGRSSVRQQKEQIKLLIEQNMVKRSARVKEMEARKKEQGNSAKEMDEIDQEACFADWTTHFHEKVYYSYGEGILIMIGDQQTPECCYIVMETEEGFRAVTENVPKNFMDALKHPIWGAPARKELDTLISTKAIVEVNSTIAKEAINNNKADLVILFPVYEKKIRDGEVVYKVRLVGDGRTHFHAENTYSATPSREELLILLDIVARNDWEFAHIDEIRAFLTARKKGEVKTYTKFRGKSNLWYEVQGALYGLRTSPRDYQDEVCERLRSLGFLRLQMCSCLYTITDGAHKAIILDFVDDFILASNSRQYLDQIIMEFRTLFNTTEPIYNPSNVLGLEISRDRSNKTISISMEGKIVELSEKFTIQKLPMRNYTIAKSSYYIREADYEHMSEKEKRRLTQQEILKYMSIVGGIIWIAGIRFDITFPTMYLTWFTKDPLVHHMNQAVHVLRYLYSSRSLPLVLGGCYPMEVTCYSDASYGTGTKGRSIVGYFIRLSSNSGSILAKSRCTNSVVLSSFEAELYAANEALKSIIYIENILQELNIDTDNNTVLYVDNLAMCDFINGNGSLKGSKHIDLRQYFIKERVMKGLLTVLHMSGVLLPADKLTKLVDVDSYRIFVDNIMGILLLLLSTFENNSYNINNNILDDCEVVNDYNIDNSNDKYNNSRRNVEDERDVNYNTPMVTQQYNNTNHDNNSTIMFTDKTYNNNICDINYIDSNSNDNYKAEEVTLCIDKKDKKDRKVIKIKNKPSVPMTSKDDHYTNKGSSSDQGVCKRPLVSEIVTEIQSTEKEGKDKEK